MQPAYILEYERSSAMESWETLGEKMGFWVKIRQTKGRVDGAGKNRYRRAEFRGKEARPPFLEFTVRLSTWREGPSPSFLEHANKQKKSKNTWTINQIVESPVTAYINDFLGKIKIKTTLTATSANQAMNRKENSRMGKLRRKPSWWMLKLLWRYWQ